MMPWLHDAHMHHYACIAIHACRLLDNLVSFGRPPTRPRKTDDRDRRSAAELFNAETHGVSGLVELPAGRMPQRCALHEICIGCASLPPPSSFLLHVPFVLMASSVGSYPLYLLRLLCFLSGEFAAIFLPLQFIGNYAQAAESTSVA